MEETRYLDCVKDGKIIYLPILLKEAIEKNRKEDLVMMYAEHLACSFEEQQRAKFSYDESLKIVLMYGKSCGIDIESLI